MGAKVLDCLCSNEYILQTHLRGEMVENRSLSTCPGICGLRVCLTQMRVCVVGLGVGGGGFSHVFKTFSVHGKKREGSRKRDGC